MRLPSIKYSGPLLFILPVIALALVFGLVASWQGRRMADELAGRVMDQATARVESSTNNYLQQAVHATDYTSLRIAAGELSPEDLRRWRPAIAQQLSADPRINSITFGNAAGDATWVIRYPDEPTMEYAISDAETDQQIVEYQVGSDGELGTKLGSYDYDPRKRPWYVAAVGAGEPTWSDVYAWVRSNENATTLGIAYARPIQDADGRLLGVLDSDISLLDVSSFLKAARVFESAEAMLVDRDGALIGTSANLAVVTPEGERVLAVEAGQTLIEDVARRIDLGATDQTQLLNVVSGDVAYRVDFRPLENPWGLDWRLAVIVPDEEIMSGVAEMRRQAWLVGGIAVLIAAGIGWLASRSLVKPVTQLVAAVRRIGAGEFDEQVGVSGHLEFEQLSEELDKMSLALKDRMQLRHSLELAMEIQQKLLPGKPPKIAGLDVAGHSTYCDETGGDYYDFIELTQSDQHELVVALGDVMGHGIAAALLMATARGILRSRAEEVGSLGEWLHHVNRLLVEDTGGERFMTMVLMVIDAQKRRVRMATAGHDPPFIYDPVKDRFRDLPDDAGLPLGIMEDEDYPDIDLKQCAPGEILLVATDGLWEGQNAEGDFYGKERVESVIRDHATESAEEIAAHITADMVAFRGEARQGDDITFVLVKFTE